MSGTSYLPLEKQNSGSSVALSLSASVPGRQHGGIALLDDLFLDSVFSAQEADPFDDEIYDEASAVKSDARREEKYNREALNLIDTRTFSSEAVTQLNTSRSIDKTVRRLYNTSLRTRPQDALLGDKALVGRMTDIVGDLAQPSLGSLSQSSSMTFSESQILPLSSHTKFLNSCYEAFRNFSVLAEGGDSNSDATSIPVGNITMAIASFCDVSPMLVEEQLSHIFTSKKLNLSWAEFKSFALFVTESDKRARRRAASPLEQGSASTALQAGASVSSIKALQVPYQQLLQKQRKAAVTLYGESALDEYSQIALSNPSYRNIEGSIVRAAEVSDALVDHFKLEGRVQRRLRQGEELGELAEGSMLHRTASAALGAEPSFSRPLQKSLVSELRGGSSQGEKWLKMRSLRDERVERAQGKKDRSNIMAAFNRTVFAVERSELQKAKYDRDVVQYQAMCNNIRVQRREEHSRLLNVQRQREVDSQRAAEAGQAFRDAVKMSTSLSKASLMEGIKVKRQYQQIAIRPQPEFTSCVVHVPVEITERVAKARTLQDWKQAKQDEKDHFNRTMGSRLAAYGRMKQNALLASAAGSKTTPVILAPINGEELLAVRSEASLSDLSSRRGRAAGSRQRRPFGGDGDDEGDAADYVSLLSSGKVDISLAMDEYLRQRDQYLLSDEERSMRSSTSSCSLRTDLNYGAES